MAKAKKKQAAHRPLKYGEETVFFKYRVPKSKLQHIKDIVVKELKKFEV